MMQPIETHTDCRSETGITVGLIDAIITMVRLLAQRDLSAPEVQEALKDLRQDEDLAKVLRVTGIIETGFVAGGDHTFYLHICSKCSKYLDWQHFFEDTETGRRYCDECAETASKADE
jgi:enoyl-CoA hydratase/carnithine racemase